MQVMFNEYAKVWSAHLYAGVGDMTCHVQGPSFRPEPGMKMRLKLVYDGIGGVQWDLNGEKKTCFLEKPAAIVHDSARRPTIGDRICDTYNPFNGYIKKVTIKPLTRDMIAVRPNNRAAFERGEEKAIFRFDVIYCGGEDISHATIIAEEKDSEDGTVFSRVERNVPRIKNGSITTLEIPVETRLKPGKYPVEVKLMGRSVKKGEICYSKHVNISIGATFADRMPAVMWGSNGPDEVVRDFGFTHVLRYFGLQRPECDPESARAINETLDSALYAGMRSMHSMHVI
jgi:hypothetical protein